MCQCLACDHFAKYHENISPRLCSLQACRSLRVPKRLRIKLLLTAHHQKFPRELRAVCCYKRLPQLVWLGEPPMSLECLWQCSSVWASLSSRELQVVGGGLYKVNAVLVLILELRTPQPATAHLLPVGPQELPKRGCGACCDSVTIPKSVLGHHRQSTAAKCFHK